MKINIIDAKSDLNNTLDKNVLTFSSLNDLFGFENYLKSNFELKIFEYPFFNVEYQNYYPTDDQKLKMKQIIESAKNELEEKKDLYFDCENKQHFEDQLNKRSMNDLNNKLKGENVNSNY